MQIAMRYEQLAHVEIFKTHDNGRYTRVSDRVVVTADKGILDEGFVEAPEGSLQLLDRRVVLLFSKAVRTHFEKEVATQRVRVREGLEFVPPSSS